MRAILTFQNGKWWTKSKDSIHKPQPFWRERRAEAVSNRGPSAYQPNALLLGQTGSLSYATEGALFISAQLSSDAVSALRKVRVLIGLWKQPSAQARM